MRFFRPRRLTVSAFKKWEVDVIRTIRANIEQIGHIHTAGVPGRHDLDDTQELYYPAKACAIAQAGYTGCVKQQFMPIMNALVLLAQQNQA